MLALEEQTRERGETSRWSQHHQFSSSRCRLRLGYEVRSSNDDNSILKSRGVNHSLHFRSRKHSTELRHWIFSTFSLLSHHNRMIFYVTNLKCVRNDMKLSSHEFYCERCGGCERLRHSTDFIFLFMLNCRELHRERIESNDECVRAISSQKSLDSPRKKYFTSV